VSVATGAAGLAVFAAGTTLSGDSSTMSIAYKEFSI
jgi:hypothetical protein